MRILEKLREKAAVLARDWSGATAIEYGLIAALIAVVAVAAWQVVGTNLSGVFNTAAGYL